MQGTTKNKVIVTLIFLGSLIIGGVFTLTGALMEPFKEHFSRDVTQIGFIVSAYSVGRMAILFLSGTLTEKFGSKLIFPLGVLFVLPFLLLSSATNNYTMVLFLSLVAGMGHGLTDTSGVAVIYDCYPKNFSSMLSLNQTFFSLGNTLSPFVISLLLVKKLNWSYLCFMYSFLVIVVVVSLSILKFPTHEVAKQDEPHPNNKKTKTNYSFFILLTLVMVLYSGISSLFLTYVTTFAKEHLGIAEYISVNFLTIFTMGGMIISFLFIFLLRKYHASIFIALNPIVGATFMFIGIFVDILPLRFISFFIVGGCLSILFSLILSLVGEIYIAKKSVLTGFIIMSCSATFILVPLVVKIILPTIGIANTFYTAFILFLFLIAVGVTFRVKYKKSIA